MANYLSKLSVPAAFKVAALVVNFVSSVVIARTLGVEKVGTSAVILSLVTQFGLFLTLNQGNDFIRRHRGAGSGKEAGAVAAEALSFRFYGALAVAPLLFVGMLLWRYYDNTAIAVPFSAMLYGLVLWVLSVNNHDWVFTSAGKVQAGQMFALFGGVLQLGYALIFLSESSSAGDDLLGSIASLFCQLAGAGYILRHSGVGISVSIDAFKRALARLKDTWRLMLSGFIKFTYLGLDVLIVGAFLGAREAGLYRIALAVAAAVHGVLSLLPRITFGEQIDAAKANSGLVEAPTYKILRNIAPVALAGIIICYLFAPIALALAYGEAYSAASGALVILLISKIVVVSSGIVSNALLSVNRDDRILKSMLLAAALGNLAKVLLVPVWGIEAAAWMNLWIEVLILLLYLRDLKKI